MSKKKKSPKINLYRNIAVTFIVFTVILLVTVFVFSYSQATIIVKSASQNIDLSFNVIVKQDPLAEELATEDVISGYINTAVASSSRQFEVLSTKTVESNGTVGQVRIVNTGSKDQPLLRTTQLQGENGVIVRTNEYVVVPAGGEVTVGVFAKDSENFQAIDPGKLTVVKLNSSSQKFVYGFNDSVLDDGLREVKVVSQSDINRAKDTLKEELTLTLKERLGLTADDYVNSEIIDYQTSDEVGQEKGVFDMEMIVEASKLEMSSRQVLDLVARKIGKLDIQGLSIPDLNMNNFSYSIIEDDYEDGILIKGDYNLQVFLDEENPILKPENFSSKSEQEVKTYLDGQDLIKSYQIFISPYWSKSFPKNEGKIEVIVQ